MYDLKKKGGKKGEKSKKDEIKELDRENEDGITILFYLQKIYPGKVLARLILRTCPKLKTYRYYEWVRSSSSSFFSWLS